VTFQSLWQEVEPIGRSPRSGGYHRLTGGDAERLLREWFVASAESRGMSVDVDRVGNQWAWLGDPDEAATTGEKSVVLGSHLDSVPEGGAFDGALGLISAFAVVDDVLTSEARPRPPIGIVNFLEEEGGRFGVTCLGSRVLTGAYDHAAALALRDDEGLTLAERLESLGVRAGAFGPDPKVKDRIGTYLELHIEQGRGLVELGRPVAVGSAIRPYGRWRVEVDGEGNHAGTTRMADRSDPMLGLVDVIQTTRASGVGRGCVATIGKVAVTPNVSNAIPSRVTAWLDARGPDEEAVQRIATDVAVLPNVRVTLESFTERERFDPELAERIARLLDDAPILESGAGHDAGVLTSAGVSSAMLFVRNPTGISHSPVERAEFDDCLSGVAALSAIVSDLVWSS
jgi:N-carbamoyl-L-amino-acid hydrolase